MFAMHIFALLMLLSLLGQESYAKCTNRRLRRMVQGTLAQEHEWSFTAWIIKDKDGGFPRYCGGSLVSRNWILTAAHCVESVLGRPWKLTINIGSSHRLKMKQSSQYLYHVDQIISHAGYAKDVLDDVALLHLNRSVPVRKYSCIDLPLLSNKKVRDGKESEYTCKAAGWGKDQIFASREELYSDSALPSSRLMEIKVPLMTIKKCFKRFGVLRNKEDRVDNRTELSERWICGGGTGPQDGTACLHDSGSPLVCKDRCGVSHLQGVAIAIHGPNIDNHPCKPGKQIIIFVRVAHYYDWIKKIIERKKQ